MKTPPLKRGWHIAQRGEWCPRDNTSIWLGDRWYYYQYRSGFRYRGKLLTCLCAVRNHPRIKGPT